MTLSSLITHPHPDRKNRNLRPLVFKILGDYVRREKEYPNIKVGEEFKCYKNQ
jgi:hypothetical protein